MSANIVVIYSGAELGEVARAIADAAGSLSARVRVLRVPASDGPDDGPSTGPGDRASDVPNDGTGEHRPATLDDLEWADGIAFGTPFEADRPAAHLMRFIARVQPLGQSDKLYDKVVTTFTDQPERLAPN